MNQPQTHPDHPQFAISNLQFPIFNESHRPNLRPSSQSADQPSRNSQLSTINSQLKTYERIFLAQIVSRVNDLFQDDSWRWRMSKYRTRPEAFARDFLVSEWW